MNLLNRVLSRGLHKMKKSVRVFKKIKDRDGRQYLVTLSLPRGTRVIRGGDGDRKMRSDQAKVVAIQSIVKTGNVWDGYKYRLGKKKKKRVRNIGIAGSARPLVYTVGAVVTPHVFDTTTCTSSVIWSATKPVYSTCAGGIHFFATKDEAISL